MVPKHQGSIGADLHLGKGFLLKTTTHLVSSRRFISDFTNQVHPMDKYYTVDTELSYAWKAFRAFVKVNNLTDRKYAEFGALDFLGRPNYYSSPERNWLAGISYSF